MEAFSTLYHEPIPPHLCGDAGSGNAIAEVAPLDEGDLMEREVADGFAIDEDGIGP